MRAHGAHAGRGRGIDPAELLAQRAWLRSLALRLVGDPAEADDLVQEAWVAAVERPPEKREALGAWLASVVKNRAVMGRRGAGRRARRERASARPEGEASTAELVERAELQKLLAEAVLGLDEPQRTAVLLRYFEGLSSAEIARRSGVPAATVRSRLARALEELRTRLDRRYEGDRGAWQRALLGLAQGLSSAPPVCHPHVPIAEGALALKSTTLAASASLAALALTAVAVWFPRGPEGASAPREVAGATPALSATLATDAPHEAQALASASTSERAALPIAAPDLEPTAFAGAAVTALEARILDPRGRALAGARVAAGSVAGTSEADGRIVLVLDGADSTSEPRELWVSAAYEGLATAYVKVRSDAEARTFVGDVVLSAATAVVGRVVTPDGGPLAGARVVATAVENDRNDPEELRRLGPRLAHPRPESLSAADGSFRLERVPVGPARVWAGSQGRAWTSSLALTLEEGRELDGLELALAPLASDDVIAGMVLDPAGEPVAGARVYYWFRSAHYGSGGAVLTDAEGRFSHLLAQRAPHDLTVRDDDDRYSAVFREDILPGTRDVVIRFEEPRYGALVVRDSAGTPVQKYEGSLRHPEKVQSLLGSLHVEAEDGAGRFRLPTTPFELEIEARGFRAETRGPLDPQSLLETLVFDLVRAPGIHGRVVDGDGDPVGGARVELYEAHPWTLIRVCGYRSLVDPNAVDQVVSDANGDFVLFPERSGTYALRAEQGGWAPSACPPFETDAAGGASGIELRLVRGGSIEGTVVSRTAFEPSGLVVAYDRGDGKPRTLRLGPDGSYRMTNLTPGPWIVELAEQEITPQSVVQSYSSLPEDEPPIEWSCTVVAGETTRYDIDLDALRSCVLLGTLRFDGTPLERFSASLEGTHTVQDEIGDSQVLAADGTFRLEVSRPGVYRIVVRAPATASGRLEIAETVRLVRGDNAWSAELESAALSGGGAPATVGTETFLEYRWGDENGLSAAARLRPDASGRFALPIVPAGAGRIVRFLPDERWGSWSDLASFELEPGETRALDLR